MSDRIGLTNCFLDNGDGNPLTVVVFTDNIYHFDLEEFFKESCGEMSEARSKAYAKRFRAFAEVLDGKLTMDEIAVD
jgi:hypothetical protein